jgi:hypothetical protein
MRSMVEGVFIWHRAPSTPTLRAAVPLPVPGRIYSPVSAPTVRTCGSTRGARPGG